MTAATFVKKDITPTPVKDDNLVTVALRRDVIAHLKWLNEHYMGETSLDDALEKAISLATYVYEQTEKHKSITLGRR